MWSPSWLLASFLAFSQAASSASITFQNLSPDPICYKVELSNGQIPTNSVCDFAPGIRVNSTQIITFQPSPDFNGAITAMTMGGFKGARHEINFRPGPGAAGHTWYDIDYEMGISNSTLGPADHRNLTNGLPSLAGEQDCLAKANAAWVQVVDKSDLAPHYYYLDSRATGNLSVIRMDKLAPVSVIEFLQIKAHLNGYIGAGSVAGVKVNPDSEEGLMVGVQDRETFMVDTQEMEIIAY